jgi:hypothetical protein
LGQPLRPRELLRRHGGGDAGALGHRHRAVGSRRAERRRADLQHARRPQPRPHRGLQHLRRGGCLRRSRGPLGGRAPWPKAASARASRR